MELKHIVSNSNCFEENEASIVLVSSKTPDFITASTEGNLVMNHESVLVIRPNHTIVVEKESVEQHGQGVLLIKSVHGVKLEKHSDEYVVTDNKRHRFYKYKSSTWAEKKFSRLSKIFANV
jgi:hypothetical protein